MDSLTAGVTAFRETYFNTAPQNVEVFESYSARQLRYALLWAMFENTIYRDLHRFSKDMIRRLGLYKYIRSIYNPANRLGLFWQTHVMGGALDPLAGDGSQVPTALPIITPNENLRPMIARLWAWSNFPIKKDLLGLFGSILGDVGIRLIDDPENSQISMAIFHPSKIRDCRFDERGNVKAYSYQEPREDPRTEVPLQITESSLAKKRYVVYTETAEHGEGDEIIFTTYLDGSPYAWNGQMARWSEPYGFVPMVLIQHNDVGFDWGWSEIMPVMPKVREVDDQASKVGDQIRKLVDAPWLLAGVSKPDSRDPKAKATPRPTGEETGQEGRQEIPIFYGPAGANAIPLVAPLNLADALANIDSLIAELERDLPELRHDIWSVEGDPSGKALRISRQPVEDKVLMRRVNYDDGIKRAMQMGMSMGGLRGYPEFTSVTPDSFRQGDLDFMIGDRPVFRKDSFDDIEEQVALWNGAAVAASAGVGIDIYLSQQGWTEENIQKILESPFYQIWLANLSGTLG